MNLNTLQNKIEAHFLTVLISLLRGNKITLTRAKEATKNLLSIFPEENFFEIKAKLIKLTKKYPEFKEILTTLNAYEEEQKTREILEKMRKFIKEGKIDEALEVAKNKNE